MFLRNFYKVLYALDDFVFSLRDLWEGKRRGLEIREFNVRIRII